MNLAIWSSAFLGTDYIPIIVLTEGFLLILLMVRDGGDFPDLYV